MHYKEQYLYIGVDLHKEKHVAVIIDCFCGWKDKIAVITFENKPSAFPEMLKEVKKHLKKGKSPIFGLEDTAGYGRSLAVFLVENGQNVKEVNSALSCAARESYPTTQKFDEWDAFCVADVLRSKLDELPTANPKDLYWTIGQIVGRRRALVKTTAALKNQLHTQLTHSFPSYRKFFSEIDGVAAMAFWEEYPSPQTLKGVTVEDLAVFLRKASRNSCSTRKAEEILNFVQQDGDTEREYQQQRDFLVKSLVREINFKIKEIAQVEEELKNIIGLTGMKLETMPGINTVMAADLIAEIGDVKRFNNADKLARFSGIAPVTFGSGGNHKEYASRQGNRTLHGIFYFLAVQQVQISKSSKKPRNPMFYEYYQGKIKAGKTKGQALVCVMRRLVSIIYGLMKNKTEYCKPELSEKQAL